MAYRDIKISKLNKNNKENLSPVFSDLIGEMEGQGQIDNFINDSLSNLSLPSNISSDPHEVKFNSDLNVLLGVYKNNSKANERWLTLMGLIERKILQLRCYKNPTLAFSLQEQKSGDNKFSYIVIRALFIDLYSGKKEIRRYFNKLEDYPNFKGLEELKSDDSFYNDALVEIKGVMAEQIQKEGITIDYLKKELTKLNNNSHASNFLSEDEVAKKKAREESAENYKMKRSIWLNNLSQEEQDEVALHKKNLKSFKGIDREILRRKEIERHNDVMKSLKSKRNINP